jgi:hypothetical protein
LVTSNQNRCSASASPCGGPGSSQSVRRFHAYCSAPATAHAAAIATIRGATIERQPPGAASSRNSA